MNRICVIDPVWTSYRLPVFEDLSAHCKVDWIFSPSQAFGTVTKSEAGDLQYVQIPMLRPFGRKNGMFQRGW